MSTVRKFVQEFDDISLRDLIADYEQFESDGMIGDCPLREAAKKLCKQFDSPYVVTWMNQIAFETYRELYYRATGRV